MKRIGKTFAGAASLVGAASVAFAHPGHGNAANGQGLAHYLTEPLHVGGAVVLVVVTFLVLRAIRARAERRA